MSFEPLYAKKIKVGTNQHGRNVYIAVELRKGNSGIELYVCGESWNSRGYDIEAGGQLQESIRSYITSMTVTEEKLSRMLEVWKRWHMNGLRAGCEHQRKSPDIWRRCLGYHSSYRDDQGQLGYINCDQVFERVGAQIPIQVERDAERVLKSAGYSVYPPSEKDQRRCSLDAVGKPCPVCGYEYGSAWMHEELPEEIIAEVKSW